MPYDVGALKECGKDPTFFSFGNAKLDKGSRLDRQKHECPVSLAYNPLTNDLKEGSMYDISS